VTVNALFVTEQQRMIVPFVLMERQIKVIYVLSVMVREKMFALFAMEQEKANSKPKTFYLLGGLMFLTLGILIYILFRDTNHIVFFWYLKLNYGTLFKLNPSLSFIKFHMVDLLWSLGFMLIIEGYYSSLNKSIIIFIWLLFLEFSQLIFNWGTFDLTDLFFIALPFFIINCIKLIKKIRAISIKNVIKT
jgi:hypothetical protein